MKNIEHYSDGERTIIWDPNSALPGIPPGQDGIGVVISGSTVTHRLFSLGRNTFKQYLENCIKDKAIQVGDAMSIEQFRQACFEVVTLKRDRAFASPTYETMVKGFALSVEEAVKSDISTSAFDLPQSIICDEEIFDMEAPCWRRW